MNMVVVLPMVVAAAEATTRPVATARGTKHCPAVAEATVHAPATVLAAVEDPAEVPATSSKTEGPATRKNSDGPAAMKGAVLSCHKTSESENEGWQGIHPLTFSLFSPLGLLARGRASADNVKKSTEIEGK
jgi:hypothetical protein